jgi:hypothetical protein
MMSTLTTAAVCSGGMAQHSTACVSFDAATRQGLLTDNGMHARKPGLHLFQQLKLLWRSQHDLFAHPLIVAECTVDMQNRGKTTGVVMIAIVLGPVSAAGQQLALGSSSCNVDNNGSTVVCILSATTVCSLRLSVYK